MQQRMVLKLLPKINLIVILSWFGNMANRTSNISILDETFKELAQEVPNSGM